MVFWFEILSFLIQIRVSHQKIRFFDRNARIFDQKTRFFYGNTRFFKNMWQMASIHTNQGQSFFFFNSKLSPGLFFVAEGAEVDAHDWNQGNCKGNILKSGREKLTDFCGTCDGKSFFQLVVALCWLQFF